MRSAPEPFVRLIETGHIILNGQLDGVVHLGGQHHIGGINFGQCIVHGLVLLGVFLRGSVHRVQTLAVAGEQPQGDALADLGAHVGSNVRTVVLSSLVLVVYRMLL
mgnify:CR=1 FL=1